MDVEQDPAVLKQQGDVLFKFLEASEAYSAAIKVDAGNSVLYANRSLCYYQLSKYEKALEDADKAISLDSSWPRGYERRGKALKKLNRLAEAIEALEKCIALNPNADNSKIEEELKPLKFKHTAKTKKLLKTILWQALRHGQKLGFGASPTFNPIYDSDACQELCGWRITPESLKYDHKKDFSKNTEMVWELLEERDAFRITPETAGKLFEIPDGADIETSSCIGNLSTFSIFSETDPDREFVRTKLLSDEIFIDEQADRAMGTFMGAPFEFSPVRYGYLEMTKGYEDSHIWKIRGYNHFELKPGQWTDDASMGLCIADSLLVCRTWNPTDARMRFLNWWRLGYCNAFGWDEQRGEKGSVGLGGNISMSMGEFQQKKNKYTKEGDHLTSGNGSIMRNAPIPVYYYKDKALAERVARKQSKTTHQGHEARECCRLLTHICIKAIEQGSSATPQSVLGDLSAFMTPQYSVECMAASKKEERHRDNKGANLNDRNWNWKDPNFKFSETRASKQPGYIGSYCMDGIAMALHCVWTTNNFIDAIMKCVNMRGDSDSVGSVCGQIAGAIYGISTVPKYWIKTVLQWDPDANIPLRAYKLWTHNTLQNDTEKQ